MKDTMTVYLDGAVYRVPISHYEIDRMTGKQIPIPVLQPGEIMHRTIGSIMPSIIKTGEVNE